MSRNDDKTTNQIAGNEIAPQTKLIRSENHHKCIVENIGINKHPLNHESDKNDRNRDHERCKEEILQQGCHNLTLQSRRRLVDGNDERELSGDKHA